MDKDAWITVFLKRLSKKNQTLQTFFDELVYGKNDMRYFKNNQILPATIYLSQEIPQMLIVVDQNNTEEYFNLRYIQVKGQSYRHEMQAQFSSLKNYLVITHERQEVVLLFPNVQQKLLFVELMKFYAEQLRKIPQINSLLISTFIATDINNNLSLSEKQINAFLEKIKMGKTEQFIEIMDYVREEIQQNTEEITFKEFQTIMKLLQCRIELKAQYEKYAKVKLKNYSKYFNKSMNKDMFSNFLQTEQFQSKQSIKSICSSIFSTNQSISFYDFSQYIASNQNSAYQKGLQKVQDTLDKSLISYYCYSSHNTYLTGNQLTSDSRTQRYLQDLQKGYRCLQIDVHNGEVQPIVKHGFTMTSSITFDEVIKAIGEYCAVNQNHTPIVLSLENHVSVEQQPMMSKSLMKSFGNKLLKIVDFKDNMNFPTLRQCLGKIIIKNSGNYQNFCKLIIECVTGAQFQQDEKQIKDQQFEPTIQKNIACIVDSSHEFIQTFEQFTTKKDQWQRQKQQFMTKQNIIKKAMLIGFRSSKDILNHHIHKDLLSITSMLSNGSIKKPYFWQSVSLSQNGVLKHHTENKQQMQNHTKKYWIRSYPAATRVDSSNYNPIPALQLGIQLIAINSQSVDHYSVLLKEFFRKGSKKHPGYRLKQYNNNKEIIQINIRPLSCSRIIQNQNSNNIPPVQVRLAFLGVPDDMQLGKNSIYANFESYTQNVKQNAFNPIFHNSQTMQTIVRNLQLSFLLIEVPKCGIGVLSLQGTRKGYRNVNLVNDSFQQYGGMVLLRID